MTSQCERKADNVSPLTSSIAGYVLSRSSTYDHTFPHRPKFATGVDHADRSVHILLLSEHCCVLKVPILAGVRKLMWATTELKTVNESDCLESRERFDLACIKMVQSEFV